MIVIRLILDVMKGVMRPVAAALFFAALPMALFSPALVFFCLKDFGYVWQAITGGVVCFAVQLWLIKIMSMDKRYRTEHFRKMRGR